MPQDADPQDRNKDLAADVLRAIRKSVRDNRINADLHPYIARSHIIAQTIHPYMNIHRVFYAGVPDAARLTDEDAKEQDEGTEEGDAEEDNMEYTEEEVYVFKAIMKLEQGFTSIISKAASRGRGDNTSKLKSSILKLLYADPKSGSKFEADYDIERLLGSDPKDIRGFYHLDTTDLLCPLHMKDEFDDDPVDFANKVIDGEIKITENDFPCFMYESGTVYDLNDEMTGLFRGYLLIRAFQQVFTGPSLALHANRNANKTKAKKFRLTKVTGHMIAYTATQTYLSLSSAKKWDTFIDNFNLDDFYGNIVKIFEQNANSPFINEMLEWWHA